MVKLISAISELLAAISFLLGMIFLWRFGPSMGVSIQRLAHAVMALAISRNLPRVPEMAHFLEDANLLSLGDVSHIAAAASCKKLGYSVGYFARKHRISREEAEKLIKRVGNDRDKLNRAAERLKSVAAR
jgi:hypothetical protein